MNNLSRVFCVSCLMILIGQASFSQTAHAQQAHFHFDIPPGTDEDIVSALHRAAEDWSALFTDSVTINVEVVLGNVDGNLASAIGSASQLDYDVVLAALTGDATSLNDSSAFGHLPNGETIDFYRNITDGTVILDNNGTRNNRTIVVSYGMQKALGIRDPDDPFRDMIITIDPSFNKAGPREPLP